jgi:hypothetical protein
MSGQARKRASHLYKTLLQGYPALNDRSFALLNFFFTM